MNSIEDHEYFDIKWNRFCLKLKSGFGRKKVVISQRLVYILKNVNYHHTILSFTLLDKPYLCFCSSKRLTSP